MNATWSAALPVIGSLRPTTRSTTTTRRTTSGTSGPQPPAPPPTSWAPPNPPPAPPPPAPPSAKTRRPGRFVERDDASFAVSVLPVEAFEALVVAANSMGQVLLEDPPYLLECYLLDPVECFCRLELFPEGGGSQVALTVVTAEGGSSPPPTVDDVRDAFITALSGY